MKSKQPVPDPPPTEPTQPLSEIDELKQQILKLQQQEIEHVTTLIEAIERDHKVGIGIQIDLQKLGDILAFMISNHKPFISLKFEIWKT